MIVTKILFEFNVEEDHHLYSSRQCGSTWEMKESEQNSFIYPFVLLQNLFNWSSDPWWRVKYINSIRISLRMNLRSIIDVRHLNDDERLKRKWTVPTIIVFIYDKSLVDRFLIDDSLEWSRRNRTVRSRMDSIEYFDLYRNGIFLMFW